MSNDDPTKIIGDNAPPTPPTQPTIETVLQRLNELGERLSAEIQSSRAEMNEGFSQVNDQLSTLNAKIDILNDDLLEVKAQQRKQVKRIDELERKAS
jgi:TolA-binding protein